MTKLAEKILSDVQMLDVEERSEIVELLYQQFGAADLELGESWASEIRRRVEDRDAGKTIATDWEVLRLEMGLPPRQS